MKRINLIILFLIFCNPIHSQDWRQKINARTELINKISKGETWQSILEFAKEDSIANDELIGDINKSILFKKNIKPNSKIDSFFIRICDSVFTSFPYRMSGNLNNKLYTSHEKNTSENDIKISSFYGYSLYPKISEIAHLSSKESIPKLLEYLKNDASTRLVINTTEWDECPYYLSVSDMAMELIEIITFCDFFDNASQPQFLFSNMDSNDKESKILEIESWHNKTLKLNQFEKVEFFLDSICKIGHSYTYTCHNLLFAGDTIRAKRKYQYYYEILERPCKIDHRVGRILLELGDRRVIEDCMNKTTNYRCMDRSGKKCIYILLQSKYASYRDNLFAEIIATEPHSSFRKRGSGPGYIWPKIFEELAIYDKYKLPLTLIELMKIDSNINIIEYHFSNKWKKAYPLQIENGFRICDLALLKYHETIHAIEINDWYDINERNIHIDKLTKDK